MLDSMYLLKHVKYKKITTTKTKTSVTPTTAVGTKAKGNTSISQKRSSNPIISTTANTNAKAHMRGGSVGITLSKTNSAQFVVAEEEEKKPPPIPKKPPTAATTTAKQETSNIPKPPPFPQKFKTTGKPVTKTNSKLGIQRNSYGPSKMPPPVPKSQTSATLKPDVTYEDTSNKKKSSGVCI